ncbi:SatD family protein [Fodinibius saliphilus]|uniref:SatD family protein n=1 Tax=Fodinibius saliphilus TaxID=1920650 RepID=UPI001109653C|nr:SatD family protein [Fodinibius saliphilus]
MDKFIVLIGDVEDSKELSNEERENLQVELDRILGRLSEGNSAIVSPYTITLGDEFQAVFKRADGVCTDILKILAELYPVKVRFSVGVGDINTPINNEQAIGMDGPAFHVARRGVEKLKKSGFLFHLSVAGQQLSTTAFINNSLQLLSQQVRSWNKNRLRILYMIKEGDNYKIITEELGISKAAFYKNKNAALLDIIGELSENMADIINHEIES